MGHIVALAAALEQAAAQGVLDGFGRAALGRGVGVGVRAVVDEGQHVPVRPLTGRQRGFLAAVGEALELDYLAVADVVADVAGEGHGKAGNLRNGADCTPGHTLVLGVGKHAVCALVRAFVGAVFAGDAVVVADGLHNTLAAIRPSVALGSADAVRAHFLGGNVLVVGGGSVVLVVAGVLLRLAGAQAVGAFVNASAVPVRAAHHFLQERYKVFVGKGDQHAVGRVLCHFRFIILSIVRRDLRADIIKTEYLTIPDSVIGSPRRAILAHAYAVALGNAFPGCCALCTGRSVPRVVLGDQIGPVAAPALLAAGCAPAIG